MRDAPRRLTILDMVVLIAGLSVGLWLALGMIGKSQPERAEQWLVLVVFILGGLSLVGPPLLLRERFRRQTRFRGAGELLWFCEGTAAWLLWPPMIVRHVQAKPGDTAGMAGICYVYGTPLMALYVTIALLAGGWLPLRRGRRRHPRSFTETFGLILGAIWACTGLYVLGLIYRSDLLR
jgi:hypothetical protein